MFPPDLGLPAVPSIASNTPGSQNVCRFPYWVPKYTVIQLSLIYWVSAVYYIEGNIKMSKTCLREKCSIPIGEMKFIQIVIQGKIWWEPFQRREQSDLRIPKERLFLSGFKQRRLHWAFAMWFLFYTSKTRRKGNIRWKGLCEWSIFIVLYSL